jgi:hypothetical protein
MGSNCLLQVHPHYEQTPDNHRPNRQSRPHLIWVYKSIIRLAFAKKRLMLNAKRLMPNAQELH